MVLYKIKDWSLRYENAQSRKCIELQWVPIPARHDAERYSEMMQREDAAELFSAWIICLQVGARSNPRGSLVRSDGSPHTPTSLSIKTRGHQKWFEKALPYLTQIGWLEQVTTDYQSATSPLPVDSEQGGQEGRKEGIENTTSPNGSEVTMLILEWNSIGVLPKVSVATDKRKKLIKTRLSEEFFKDNWKSAIERVKSSAFCTGSNERGWKADIDWFLRPDTVPKIMEGKYDNKSVKIQRDF